MGVALPQPSELHWYMISANEEAVVKLVSYVNYEGEAAIWLMFGEAHCHWSSTRTFIFLLGFSFLFCQNSAI